MQTLKKIVLTITILLGISAVILAEGFHKCYICHKKIEERHLLKVYMLEDLFTNYHNGSEYSNPNIKPYYFHDSCIEKYLKYQLDRYIKEQCK